MFRRVGFIGLGLIGGSLAKSIKKYHLAKEIIAYNRDQSVLQAALEEQVIDVASPDIGELFCDCDLIFLCCPVQVNVEAFQKLMGLVSPDCIITDVGSTKMDIMESVRNTPAVNLFIGGHPMAGSEKTKYSASNDHLFENAYYILTPFEDTDSVKLQALYDLVGAIKAIPLVIDANQHDFVTATISHVPHVIAASLVNIVKQLDNQQHSMHTLAAGGFKDITRIASSSPIMWQQICLTNQGNILKVLESFQQDLSRMIQALKEENPTKIYDFFDHARCYRDSFQERTSGALFKSYSFTIDVEDKLGIIARIATLLSEHEISIKNIGIINNREYTNGVLEIVFYEEEAMRRSILILKEMNYTVYTDAI